MFKNLNAGAIGIRDLSLADTIALAKRHGFKGIDFNIREAAALADQHGLAYVRQLFEAAGIQPGSWGLPVAWNKEEQWQADLVELPRLAKLGRELGSPRTATWCPSGSNERPYDENFAWHVERFGAIAKVLNDYGCRFGIEFLGPQHIRDSFKYPFVYTMAGMLDLAAVIGTGNVGLLLDAWHLYTSGGNVDDLAKLTASDVVTVHVNDAPAGVPREAQRDNVRCLPMETGVIDLPGFMRGLAQIEYDGPVTCEPFNQRLNELEDPDEAAGYTAQQMDKMWQAAGLA